MSGGDEYDAVYRELFLPAMRIAFKILGDRDAAEDVAAESLARAFANWRKVQGLPHRNAWVLRVATNLAIDQTRKRRLPIGRAQHDEFEDATSVRLALAAALRALPKRQRDSIALYYLGGMSEGDVSDALGISASSVRTHLQRGLAALRGQFGTEIGGGDVGTA